MFERRRRGPVAGASCRGRKAGRQERGASLPLVAIVLAAMLMMTGVVIGLGVRVVDQTRAQAAADAAALAGVIEGRGAAARLAAVNGGELVAFEERSNAVRVVVEIGGRRAEARAERSLEAETGG